MKSSAFLVSFAVAAVLVLLAGCQPDTNLAETDSCLECHSGDTTEGNVVLAAQAQYENSGHLNGPRMLDPFEPTTGHIYVFHGSNAMYTNGGSCVKCHNHEAFVDFVETGTPDSFYSAASPPGCFTCHKPHISGDFSLRKESKETLVDTLTEFNWGKGNLCVTCHKSLSNAATFLTGFPKDWSSSSGPHHGPQADFMMGVNSAPITGKTYVSSDHLDAALPDSCVSCHMYQPAARMGGTLQLGGHGMYLSGDVHGTNTNVIGACRSCHAYSGTSLVTSATSTLTSGFEATISPDLNVNTRLDEIRANRDLLIAYFGNGTANFGGNGAGPIEGADDGLDQTSGEWGREWVFAAATGLDQNDSYALWNLKLFIEDKSQGIHNPVFAHEILWDAVEAIGGTPVGSRP